MATQEARNYAKSNVLPLEFRRAVANEDYSIIAPRKPILLPQKGTCATLLSTQRWSVTRNRKANILATARQLIAEESYDHVVMRQLAERSEVSIPTIYNLIGGRNEVLQLATSEALQAKIVFAMARSEVEQINPILAFVDTLWMCLVHDPEYSRQVMRGVVYRNSDGGMGGHLFDEIQAVVEKWLTTTRANGNFRNTGITTRAMAGFITRQTAAAVAFWMENGMTAHELRCNLAQGTGLLLLGALPNEAAAGVTKWLKRLEQMVPEEGPPAGAGR